MEYLRKKVQTVLEIYVKNYKLSRSEVCVAIFIPLANGASLGDKFL
jgi:hypothetical protein